MGAARTLASMSAVLPQRRTSRRRSSADQSVRVIAGLAGLVLAVLLVGGCGVRQAPGAAAGSAAKSAAAGEPARSARPARSAAPARGSVALSPSPSAGPPSQSAPAIGALAVSCPPSALTVRLDTSAAGVAAGSSVVPLQIRNVSGRECTLPTYPAIWFASSTSGPAIGAAAAELQVTSTRTLAIRPGRYAHAWLQISAVASYPASSCKPVTAHGLRISFAQATAAVYVAARLPTCSRTPQGASILAVYPVEPGLARRGTAP
jgi:hypothetical protein